MWLHYVPVQAILRQTSSGYSKRRETKEGKRNEGKGRRVWRFAEFKNLQIFTADKRGLSEEASGLTRLYIKGH
jgi:muconolactone delta-isomerase